MKFLENINLIIGIFFILCYAYQAFYILVPFIKKPKAHKKTVLHDIGILISARNEADVIGQLLDSIAQQDYPADRLRVFLVADNCTDETAHIARQKGAIVYERFNTKKVGKGYALSYLLSHIDRDFGLKTIDAFIVLDADNVLEPNYVTEMNKTYCDGYRITTSYRNSKNYAANWISAGYALWFLREAKYLNNSRMLLGTSCAVSGTGFLFAREILEERHGWNYHLLTEDIEFTCDSIVRGERIGYCADAVLYDEQPVTFRQSWNQRMRWAKGFLQVMRKHGKSLFKGIFSKNFSSCFDMFMTISPAYSIVTVSIGLNILGIFFGLMGDLNIDHLLRGLAQNLVVGYVMLFLAGIITTVTEWKSIHCPRSKKILYAFTFPFFMFTYIPISVAVFFKKVEWSPIKHSHSFTVEQIKQGSKAVSK